MGPAIKEPLTGPRRHGEVYEEAQGSAGAPRHGHGTSHPSEEDGPLGRDHSPRHPSQAPEVTWTRIPPPEKEAGGFAKFGREERGAPLLER